MILDYVVVSQGRSGVPQSGLLTKPIAYVS